MSQLNKLRWHCRRGIKELDQLLVNFLDHHYCTLLRREQQLFTEELLTLEDDILYGYFFTEKPVPKELQQLVTTIRVTAIF